MFFDQIHVYSMLVFSISITSLHEVTCTSTHFFDFCTTYLFVSPTDLMQYMYVYQRRTTPSDAYKKHENENKFHCFDRKNGCFAL
jgi:hypothetical protein